jgi:hypothetical protein
MLVIAMGSWFLYDALYHAVYRVVRSCWLMYYGDKVFDHLGGVYSVHIVAYAVSHDANILILWIGILPL